MNKIFLDVNIHLSAYHNANILKKLITNNKIMTSVHKKIIYLVMSTPDTRYSFHIHVHKSVAVTWLKYCRYVYAINQSIKDIS